MLQWICPECGRECEPSERDCPVCYPGSAPAISQKAAVPAQAGAKAAGAPPPPLPAPYSLAVADVPDIPTLPACPIPAPRSQPPDPVPAGLSALSGSMRTFDSRGVSGLSPAEVRPLPSGSPVGLGLECAPIPGPLSTGAFALRGGSLERLSPPDFARLAEGPALDFDGEWLPLSESLHPALGRRLEDVGVLLDEPGVDPELRALEAAGLAPACPAAQLEWNVSKPHASPVLTAACDSIAWPESRVAAPGFAAAPAVDDDLRARVGELESEQRELRELDDAAAHKCSRLFADPDAIGAVSARTPRSLSPDIAFRGYAPWPQAEPVGRPVSRFELEFDPQVLESLREIEAAPPQAVPREEEQVSPQLALMTLRQALTLDTPAEARAADFVSEPSSPSVEALTPIVERMAPPLARLTPLPMLDLQPAGQQARARATPPQAEFSDASPLVPAGGKLIKIIPSPIMNIQHSRVTAPPGWLVTAAIALLIPITALGVVNYWILPSQRSAPPTPAVGAVAPDPAAAPPVAPAPSWQRQLELTGLRLQNSTVKCIVVNHGKENVPALSLLVTLRSARAAGEPPVGTFRVRLSPLAAGDSREIAEPISFAPPMRSNVDWTDLKAEIQITRP